MSENTCCAYDFAWYTNQGIKPNLLLLEAALDQYGPWQGQRVPVDAQWVQSALRDKIMTVEWSAAAQDVTRFLKPIEQRSLQLWSPRFFLSKVDQLPGGLSR